MLTSIFSSVNSSFQAGKIHHFRDFRVHFVVAFEMMFREHTRLFVNIFWVNIVTSGSLKRVARRIFKILQKCSNWLNIISVSYWEMKKLCISAHTIRNDFFYWPSRYTISLTKYFFLFSLLQLHKKIYKTTARLDLFYPFFLTLQFAFYVGWLKANNSHDTLSCLFPLHSAFPAQILPSFTIPLPSISSILHCKQFSIYLFPNKI